MVISAEAIFLLGLPVMFIVTPLLHSFLATVWEWCFEYFEKKGGIVEDKELDWALITVIHLKFKDEAEFHRASEIIKSRGRHVSDLVLSPDRSVSDHGLKSPTLGEKKKFMDAIEEHCLIIEKYGMYFADYDFAQMYQNFLVKKKLSVFGEVGT